MKTYIMIFITLIFCNINLVANENCYKVLGITTSKSQKTPKTKIAKKNIKIKKLVSKKNRKNSLSKILKHTKVKKISKDTTLYGIGAEYKLSKKVQLSVDILAKVDTNRDSISIQEKSAQLKVALSI